MSSARLTMPATFESRAILQPRSAWGQSMDSPHLMTIQSLGFSFTDSLRRRTAVVGLSIQKLRLFWQHRRRNDEKRLSWSRTFRPGECSKWDRDRSPTLTLATLRADHSTIPAPSPPMTDGSFGFKVIPVRTKRSGWGNRRISCAPSLTGRRPRSAPEVRPRFKFKPIPNAVR